MAILVIVLVNYYSEIVIMDIGQLAIYVVIIAAIIALVTIAIRQFNISIPSWVVQVFWVVIVALVIIFAIKLLLNNTRLVEETQQIQERINL